jgi:hypothetical protein
MNYIRSPFLIKKDKNTTDLSASIAQIQKYVNLGEISKLVAELASFKARLDALTEETVNKYESEIRRVIGEAETQLRRTKAIQKGDKPIAGIDYPIPRNGIDGVDGVNPSPEDIVPLVLAKIKIPQPKNGETPIKGIHYFDGKSVTVDEVLETLKKKKIKPEHIDGLQQTLHALQTQTRQGYLHGGGVPSLSAGSNVVLTPKSDGGFTVSAIVGAGIETPSGVINGSNTTFTVLNIPKYIISDGATYFESAGYTRVGLTLTLSVPPVDFIRSFY